MATSLDDVLICPITLQLFQDPVVAEDGHTYERNAIIEWICLNGTSPLTRQPLSVGALRPNFTLKTVIEQFESKLQEKRFTFKLNIDVRREKRAMFQTFGKSIYKAEWINQQEVRPPIIILKIDGARANKEASFYVDLSRHPHIVRTYGLVEDPNQNSSSVMLLQEYASEGSLYELLNDQTEVPDIKVLKEMFIQIADAMIFLAYNGIVHGDLACRNVLIFRFDPNESKRNLIKLTDFGLSRFSTIYSSVTGSVSTTTINIIPIRTAAPEILINNCPDAYSEKSDIFSIGMLMIEALNKGAIPWADVADDNEVQKLVSAGNRPPRPRTKNCTDEIWKIISHCLAQLSTKRPTFKELREQLNESERQRSGYSSTNNAARTKPSNVTTAPNSLSHENYQQGSTFTTYSSPQYPPDFQGESLKFQNGFFNSTFSVSPPGTNWQVHGNNSYHHPNRNPRANLSYTGVNNMAFKPTRTTQQNSAHSTTVDENTTNQNNEQQGSEVHNVGNYHSIEAYGAFEIILDTDGPETVKLTSEQPQLLRSVKTTVERGILKLKMSGTGSNTFSSWRSVTIVNNNINMVNYPSNIISGIVTVHIRGARHLTNLIVGGQCNVESRSALTGDAFQLVLSGSSSFDGSLNVKQLNVSVSGSSRVSFGGSTSTVMLQISGSSSCHTKELKTNTAQIQISGCSNTTLRGSTDTILLNVSGSSSCEALEFEAKTVRVSASGASHARVYCTQTLETDVTKGSGVNIKAMQMCSEVLRRKLAK